jgi:NAD(P)H-quinone oxidoreductase subunit 4
MLSALIIIPLLGALILGLWPGRGPDNRPAVQMRQFAAVVQGISLAWVVVLGCQFDIQMPGMQFVESLAWVESLGLTYQLGVDGLALPLLFINSLLGLIAVWASPVTIQRPRFYWSLLLIINSAVAGAFVAQNLLLFFIFYELELIPLYLLIAIWGGARRAYAATKFLIYTAVSGILILGGFLGVVWLGGGSSFDYDPTLAASIGMVPQLFLLGAMLVGFGIKIPLFPFHTWLPDAHVEASTPVSVLLAGVLLKLGTYGLVRFGLQLFPDAWTVLSPWLAGWAVVSVLYGSLAAIAQTDMKKMVAYSSIGHMGYILLAAAAATPLSVLGTVMQMVSHGLISGLLFLLVGLVYSKTGTRDLTILRGLLNPERGLTDRRHPDDFGGDGQWRPPWHGGLYLGVCRVPGQHCGLPGANPAVFNRYRVNSGLFPIAGESRFLWALSDSPADRCGHPRHYAAPRDLGRAVAPDCADRGDCRPGHSAPLAQSLE